MASSTLVSAGVIWARSVTKVLLFRYGECPVALAFESGKCGRGTLNVLLNVGRILIILFHLMPGRIKCVNKNGTLKVCFRKYSLMFIMKF